MIIIWDLTIQQVLEQPIRNDFVSENCRAFVLGEEENPKNVDLYYWYYPFSNIYVNPFMGYSIDLFAGNGKIIYGAMIKCSPIAVFILDKKVSTMNPPGLKIVSNLVRNFDSEKSHISIMLR